MQGGSDQFNDSWKLFKLAPGNMNGLENKLWPGFEQVIKTRV